MLLGLCVKNLTASENQKLMISPKKAKNNLKNLRKNHKMRKNSSARSLRKGQEPPDHLQTGDSKEGTPSERDSRGTRELAMIRLGPDMTKQTHQAEERTSMQTSPETENHLTHSLGSENDSRAPQDKKEVPLARHPLRGTPGGETDRNTEATPPRPVEADSRKLEKPRWDMETP